MKSGYVSASRSTSEALRSNISAVLLGALALLESSRVAGLFPGILSLLPFSLDRLLATILVLTSISAVFLMRNGRDIGGYLGVFSSASITGMGLVALIRHYSSGTPSLPVSSYVSLLLGSFGLACLTRPAGAESLSLGGKRGDMLGGDSVAGNSVNAVETLDVRKSYVLGSGEIAAVNGISLKVPKGEFVSIMGPSGSGKSTLLNLIGALDRPSAGKVLIDGINISELNDDGLAKIRNEKIGFVFQAYNLVSRSTVARNLELPAMVKGYPSQERAKRVETLLGVVGISDKIGRKPKTMSGGEQQRVAIARALMNDPEIILADEPTGNVDSRTGKAIMQFLRRLNIERKRTVIVITHDLDVARIADRIVQIRDGKIIGEEMVGGDRP